MSRSGKSKRSKKPRSEYTPKPRKQPKSVAPAPPEKQIIWSFALFDDYRWSDPNPEGDSFYVVGERLKQHERLTWTGVEKNKWRNHSVNLDDLIKPARDRLRKLKLDDTDFLWRFRFSGREPPWVDARRGLQPGERGGSEITQAAMAEYYGGLSGSA